MPMHPTLHRLERSRDGLARWIAWHLPQAVVYHALIRAWAHATQGRYGDTVVPAVTADEVVRRWEKR